MSEFRTPESELRTVRYFRAPQDNRVVALYVRGDFDEFEKFPPYLDTPEERAHMAQAYKGADPDVERDDNWPLQIVMLERMPGGTTLPHYHIPDRDLPPLPTRHQILLCQRGSAKVRVFTKEGVQEFLEPRTRLIEIKQGPFPDNDTADKIDIPQVVAA